MAKQLASSHNMSVPKSKNLLAQTTTIRSNPADKGGFTNGSIYK
jgi:hypothetical protein